MLLREYHFAGIRRAQFGEYCNCQVAGASKYLQGWFFDDGSQQLVFDDVYAADSNLVRRFSNDLPIAVDMLSSFSTLAPY